MLSFKSKITEKLLGYYFLNRMAVHYINELAKILSVDPGNLDRKIKQLEKEGIFISEKRGNQKYFYLNKKYPLLSEIRKIYNLKYGLENKLAEAVKKIKGAREAYIFGSYAKKNFGPESDIDILLVGGHSALEAIRTASAFEKQFKREFNIVNLTEKEFAQKKKEKDDFIANILKGKAIKIL